MKFDILTLFPEMFGALGASMTGRAEKDGIVSFNVVNIRDFSDNKHKRTDDYPFGGGRGMLLMPQPLFDALESVGADNKRVIYLSPRGRIIDREYLEELAREDELVLLCGHYEGVDQRVLDRWDAEEVSIGDYVLTGGELPAMVLIDAVTRLIPGVLATPEAAVEESVYSGLLEAPQYTQPREYAGLSVPDVLVSGDHRRIHLWHFEQSLIITKQRRPDLFDAFARDPGNLDKDERKILEKVLEM